jgi:hypothetical protein
MLVKELIQELQKFNPEDEMLFTCGIESGRSYDSCSNGDWDLDVEDLDDDDEIREQLIKEMGYEDEEDLDEDEVEELNQLVENYKPRVVFNISGECTDYQ